MLESLEILQTKVKKMEQANDVIIEAILAEDEGKLSKKKEEIVEDYVSENEAYLENSRKVQGQLEELLEKADEILAEARQEPVNTQDRQATDTAVPGAAAHAQTTSNNDFRPHSNLKPNYLEKSSSHLEVKTFCEQIQAYIRTGYRSTPPQGPQGVWFHIKACMHSTWYTALEQKGALNESLEKILEMIQEESCLRNPVHSRRMGFLQSKRGNMSHSDFWAYLEEQIPLIEFDKLTAVGLAAHIFLQEGDPVMRKMTSEHLESTDGKADARKLCNEIRSIEASQWYDSRNQAKRVGAGAGGPGGPGGGGAGGRWCTTCQSSSHDTEKCWGRCKTCSNFGHPTHLCWENPGNGKPQGAGAAKAVQITNPPSVPPPNDPTPEEIAAKKAKQKEKNKKQALKRKEKKAKKKKEAEEAKSAAAAGRETPPLPPLAASSSSSSEEEISCQKQNFQSTWRHSKKEFISISQHHQ